MFVKITGGSLTERCSYPSSTCLRLLLSAARGGYRCPFPDTPGWQGPSTRPVSSLPLPSWYFLMAFILITCLQQYYFSSKVETIPYSQFKQDLVTGNVT